MLHFPVEKTSHTSLAPIIDVAKNTELGARVADWLLLQNTTRLSLVLSLKRDGVGGGDLGIQSMTGHGLGFLPPSSLCVPVMVSLVKHEI
jgi:hypothetical protein